VIWQPALTWRRTVPRQGRRSPATSTLSASHVPDGHGLLPYETPTPRTLDRLMRASSFTAPRVNATHRCPGINDIILRALVPDFGALRPGVGALADVLAVREPGPTAARVSAARRRPRTATECDIHSRLRAASPRRLRLAGIVASRCTRAHGPLPVCGRAAITTPAGSGGHRRVSSGGWFKSRLTPGRSPQASMSWCTSR
jgi:hypothetical protein